MGCVAGSSVECDVVSVAACCMVGNNDSEAENKQLTSQKLTPRRVQIFLCGTLLLKAHVYLKQR